MQDTIQLGRREDDLPTVPLALDSDREEGLATVIDSDAPGAPAFFSDIPDLDENSSPSLLQWVGSGLRAAMGLSVHAPSQGPGAWQMLWVLGLSSAFTAAITRLEVPGAAQFVLPSWLLSWAPSALLLFGVWVFLHGGRRHATLGGAVASWWLMFAVASVPMTGVAVLLSAAAAREQLPVWWPQSMGWSWGVFGFFWGWLIWAVWRITAAVNRSRWVGLGVMLCVCAVQSADTWLLDTRYWQADDAGALREPEPMALSQEVFELQQALLAKATQSIRPASPAEGDVPQLFALVYAPYAQDVFMRESGMVQEVLETRFAAQGRVIRLLNHPRTAESVPWATTRNLQQSLQALSVAMNPQRDVLVVYMTSHGGADYTLAAAHAPLAVPDLTAQELRGMLDSLGIRNRVIAVSACYSGGWVEPLEGEFTFVMTAADKEHTSYGCGSLSELTFFGRAVFDEQLRQKTKSFEDAFRASVPVIAQREVEGKKTDGFSNPQISIGAGIKPVLGRMEQALITSAANP